MTSAPLPPPPLSAVSSAAAATANSSGPTIIGFLKSTNALPLYLLILLILYIVQIYYCSHWSKYKPNPLKKEILKSLPKLTLSQECFVTVRICKCVICLEDYVVDDVVRVLPHCGHDFHAICIDKWFQFGSTCPSCRRVPVACQANNLPLLSMV